MIVVYVGYDFVPYNLCLKRFDACLELRAEKRGRQFRSLSKMLV